MVRKQARKLALSTPSLCPSDSVPAGTARGNPCPDSSETQLCQLNPGKKEQGFQFFLKLFSLG